MNNDTNTHSSLVPTQSYIVWFCLKQRNFKLERTTGTKSDLNESQFRSNVTG